MNFLAFCLDSGQRKKHLRDRRTTMNALEGGAYQDADMTESDSEEEVNLIQIFTFLSGLINSILFN